MMTCGTMAALAAETGDQVADEAAIRKAVAAYVAAYNRGDAKALAALWSPEAVYTSPLTGEQVVGREAIEQQFAAIFAEAKGAKLEARTDSIQFVSPNVAVEHGVAAVVRPDEETAGTEETEYTAVYIKRDGQWLLDRVTEEETPVAPPRHGQLKELEWMIGEWVDQDEQSRIDTHCQWTRNQNFMIRWFTLAARDRIEMAGVQIIGWDPAANRIRSWVFDSDGGFGEGVWNRKGKTWHIQLNGTLPDGRKSSSVNIITYVDDNTFTWQSVNRQAGGVLLPNVDEVIVVRKKQSE
ncbi:MAG: SgcJ/EcaC family oxidoreductase [Pirellulaceae bacterium]|nr:SgcJ/EcaC family oxidoreductase [Pirellulaceae bacterium]